MAGQFDTMTSNSMRRWSLARSPQPGNPLSPSADITSQEAVGAGSAPMTMAASGQLSMGILGVGLIALAAVYIATRSKQK